MPFSSGSDERPPLSKGHAETPKAIAGESAFADAGIELLRGRRPEGEHIHGEQYPE